MSLDLFECLTLTESGSPLRVDRERGVIGPVKVLGWKSANGREYLRAGVAPSLYEGKRVCMGHVKGGGERSPLDTYGLLEGVTVKQSGVYADRLRLLNPRGDFEQRLLTAAESAPHLFGLSHTARGREKPGSYGSVIEAVESVQSVDLVSDPATVAGLYESRNPPVKKKLRDVIDAVKPRRPGLAKIYQEMAEAGVMSPDAPMDAPPEEPAAGGGDHKQAIRDAMKAMIDDDSLSEGDLLKKLKALLKVISDGGGGELPGESAETEEQSRMKAENGQLLAEKLVRKAAGAAKLALSETLVEALARPGMTEQQAQAVVSELGGASQKPRSAAPFTPKTGADGKPVQEGKTSNNGGDQIPADARGRAAWLRRG